MQFLASIDQEIAHVAERKRLIKNHLGADNCWGDRDFVALDAEYHRLLDQRREIATTPAKPPARFGRSIVGGVEKIWIRDVPAARKIAGIATTPSINSHRQVKLSKGCNAKLPVPLLSEHAGDARCAIGEVYYIEKSEAQVYVRARLFETEAANFAWGLIDRGEMRCFSVASKAARVQGIVDGIKFFDSWDLSEVSICRQGANKDACFDIISRGSL